MASAVPEQMTPERGTSGAAAQQRTALLSVMAAAFLLAVKLATGLVTGSLGLIAEAAHSGTDLVAALSIPGVREVHNVRVMQIDGRPELSLHVKLPRDLALGEAHAVVEQLESALREAVPELRGVHTHIEPLSDTDWATRPARGEVAEAREAIEEVVRSELQHHPSLRRRARTVPVYLGESLRVLEWIDVIG